MKKQKLIFVMLLLGAAAAPQSRAAVLLSSMQNPSLQSLINLGSSGVDVGSEQFYNFSFINGGTSGPTTASQIQVEPISNSGQGIEFASSWIVANGANTADVISYDVSAVAPAQNPSWMDLFFNGTAPAPAAGTFTSVTLTAQTDTGAPAAPLLSTYNDGVTSPVDTTKPDVDFASAVVIPTPALEITDSIFADSTAPSSNNTGGLATISVIQNSFGSVPEPSMMGWIFPPAALLVGGFRRRRAPR